jgi:hypothetical protein
MKRLPDMNLRRDEFLKLGAVALGPDAGTGWPPRPRDRGRTEAHGAALLHEPRLSEVRQGGVSPR